ncbi:methylmalonyl-CoA mutase subunit beta [Lutibacter sp.]|uniref:methylmalonyl-CoA mutase subunit beta n=1 Tax=Lutibacter sp. TaxID=1925666 RepID=UPI0025BA0724|nr:methylmalonyl-CoA mutase subunit beta [Lutibacter sp.]MCF6168988.1 methylmalonyl-CoA mutase subunit beta [Lutibacter sp.]
MSTFITKDFEPSSAKAWKQKIQVDLKGADYNSTLLTKTNEGITIKPFYHLDNFEKLNIPTPKKDFKVCQKILISAEDKTNTLAIESINRGANALKFIANKPFNASKLFKNLLNKKNEFHFQFEFLSKDFIDNITKLLNDETVFYNIDIIGNIARNGNWFTSLNNDFKIVEKLIQENPTKYVLGVNTNLYQNAGANTAQQIAYALAHANEYLNRFDGKIASKIQFNFSMGSNYFFEIAKIRAFRYLYNLISQEYNTTTVIAEIFTEPSLRNKTIYDYNVNMLRTTTESMSAILGGANTISNCSYDILFHNSNEFGDRIARNQLLILKEESYFKNAQYIATDSYYIETITKQLAEKALDIFKDIEKSGGFLQQLKEGTIQRKIKENAQKEQTQFDLGELILVGTNKYMNEQDKMSHDLQINPFVKHNPKKTLIIPIIPKRLSEKIEQKRLKNEA